MVFRLRVGGGVESILPLRQNQVLWEMGPGCGRVSKGRRIFMILQTASVRRGSVQFFGNKIPTLRPSHLRDGS